MDKDVVIARAMSSYLHGIEAPRAPIQAILDRAGSHARPRFAARVFAAWAAAVAVLAIIVVPLASPGVVMTMEQRVAELLQWKPPAGPPKSLLSSQPSGTVDLERARRSVDFTVAQPQGLPDDVVSSRIALVASAVYSNAHRSWSAGPPTIRFSYVRRDHREFTLMATSAALAESPSRYIFNADEHDAKGLPVRYEQFAWRNGNQLMTCIAEGITPAEIEQIRSAMHGVAVATVWPPTRGKSVKMLVAPKP